MESRLARPILYCLLLFLLPLCCAAQIDRSGLSGTVLDSTGGRIPGAHIAATQIATGVVRETVASSNGTYDIPELAVGVYRIVCSASGFQQITIDGLEQTVGHTRTLDLTLRVTGLTQQVSVSAQTSQMDETTAALGARIEPRQFKDLPLNGRNWSTLTALVPGAVDTGGNNQRPNRVPGVSLVPAGGRSIDGWINPAAFSLVTGSGYGDTPRNLARGPGLWQADLGLAKYIPIAERVELRFSSQFFNVFNRAQYGQPLADFSSSTFGQIIGTVNPGPVGSGTPRQMQFALRLEF